MCRCGFRRVQTGHQIIPVHGNASSLQPCELPERTLASPWEAMIAQNTSRLHRMRAANGDVRAHYPVAAVVCDSASEGSTVGMDLAWQTPSARFRRRG